MDNSITSESGVQQHYTQNSCVEHDECFIQVLFLTLTF